MWDAAAFHSPEGRMIGLVRDEQFLLRRLSLQAIATSVGRWQVISAETGRFSGLAARGDRQMPLTDIPKGDSRECIHFGRVRHSRKA